MEAQQYVRVKGSDGKVMGICLSPTGKLNVATLKSAFNNFYGLKYQNPNFNILPNAPRFIVLSMDSERKYFNEPPIGWTGVFEVIYRSENEPLPRFDKISKFLFYVQDEKYARKECVVAVTAEFFVTSGKYEIGQSVRIFSHNDRYAYETTVKSVSQQYGFVILQSNSTELKEGPSIDYMP
uniref:Uncharacterized protein n=1 Tax=Meloidogyne enterolobii TaxID=390850 RepID=A0A6V7TMH7_MELEN|nr:unnamed protein product [Meloidogyne enterolobii]